MQEITAFKKHLQNLITNQSQKDSLELHNQDVSLDKFLEEGLRVLNFYQCFSCQSIYYGGLRVCGEAGVNIPPEELLCSSCRNHCEIHGDDHMIYKCRFCCTVASYFCFGHTHFCESCHANAFELLQGSNQGYLKHEVAQCSGSDLCPLKIDHPPNGEEFAIGCAMCKQEEEPPSKVSEEKEEDSNSKKPAFTIQIHTGDIPVPEVKQPNKRKRRNKRRKMR